MRAADRTAPSLVGVLLVVIVASSLVLVSFIARWTGLTEPPLREVAPKAPRAARSRPITVAFPPAAAAPGPRHAGLVVPLLAGDVAMPWPTGSDQPSRAGTGPIDAPGREREPRPTPPDQTHEEHVYDHYPAGAAKKWKPKHEGATWNEHPHGRDKAYEHGPPPGHPHEGEPPPRRRGRADKAGAPTDKENGNNSKKEKGGGGNPGKDEGDNGAGADDGSGSKPGKSEGNGNGKSKGNGNGNGNGNQSQEGDG